MAKKPVTDNYAEHERTYTGFLKLTKWSIIAMVVVVIALYFIIQP